jgi:hypothetical protein
MAASRIFDSSCQAFASPEAASMFPGGFWLCRLRVAKNCPTFGNIRAVFDVNLFRRPPMQ